MTRTQRFTNGDVPIGIGTEMRIPCDHYKQLFTHETPMYEMRIFDTQGGEYK